MKKRVLAVILAFALVAGSYTEVYATEAIGTTDVTVADETTTSVSDGNGQTETAENDEQAIEQDGESEEIDEQTTMSPEEWEALNDPLYSKYMYGINLMAEVSSASEITHDARFDKYDKVMGIDVSKWQGDIDWSAVKDDGIDFAIIRLGYRGMQDGTLYTDPYFAQNMEGAYAAGVSTGAYLYTQAITVEEAEEEARYVVEQLEQYKGYVTYPVIIDIEAYEGSRLDNALLTPQQKTEICAAFCEIVEEAGYTAGVYSNKYYWETYLNAADLEKYYVWMAHYTSQTSYAGRYDMWQFSSTGSINGISGNVDLDVAYVPTVPGTPEEFSRTSAGDTSITLSWKSVKNVDGYRVYCYDESGKSLGSQYTTSNSLKYSGLKSGVIYQFKVRSYYDTNGTKTWGKFTTAIKAATKPEQVTGVQISTVATDSVSLSWTKLKNLTGYRVYCYNSNGKQLGFQDTTSNNLKYSGLESGVTYQFKVRAYVDLDGTKIWGNKSSVVKVITKPAKVVNLKLSSATTNKLEVKWSKVTGAEGYKISLYNAATGKSTTLGTTTRTSYTISNLESGTQYSVKVAAYVKNGGKTYQGAYSDNLKTATKPDKVEGVKAKAINTKSANLTWTKQSNVSGYRVDCYDASGKSLGSQYTTTNSLRYTGLKEGVTYQFKVRAYVEVGDTKITGNASTAIKLTTKPAKVSNLKLSSATTNKLVVNWSKVTGAEGYKVSLYNEETGKTTVVGTTSKTAYTIKNLDGGTKYSVKVAAYVENNEKVYMGSYSTSLDVATKPAKVTELKQTAGTAESVTLSWKSVQGATGYQIYCYDSEGNRIKTIDTTKRRYTLKGLEEGEYSFKVRAYVKADDYTAWGGFSATLKATVE